MKRSKSRPLKKTYLEVQSPRGSNELNLERTTCGVFFTTTATEVRNNGKKTRKRVSKGAISCGPTQLKQRKIDEFLKSPKSTCSTEDTRRSSSAMDPKQRHQEESLSSGLEDEVKNELIWKVNKLFVNDLSFPPTNPYGIVKFSCSSLSCCTQTNHQVPVEEMNKDDQQVLKFLVSEGCWYLLGYPLLSHITETVHLSPLLFRSILYGITVERDDQVCMQLIDVIKTHLRLHPPCRKDLRMLYYSILLGKIKIGELTNPEVVKYNFYNIINAIEEASQLLVNEETLSLSVTKEAVNDEMFYEDNKKLTIDNLLNYISKTYIDNENILSLPEFKYQKEVVQEEDKMNPKKLLQRLFNIFSLSLDILEENFRIWWMKSRYKFNGNLNSARSLPFIADVGWKKFEKKGSVNEHCVQIFMLYRNCPVEYAHQLSRYIALLFEVAQVNEENENCKFPYFNKLCNAFAKELAFQIRGDVELNKKTLTMTQYIYPLWLRFKVCGVLLKSEITSKGKDDLCSALRVILRNLTNKTSSKTGSSMMHLRPSFSLQPAKANQRDPTGETIIHKYCRNNSKSNLNKLTKYLRYPGTNVNIRDNAGWTPLHNAAEYNVVECVELLIAYRLPPINGAEELNIFALNENNDSPLMCAVKNGNIEIIDILLQNGAGTTVWNKNSDDSCSVDLASPDIKEKLLSSWKSSIASFQHLSMKPIEVDILTVMVCAYCSVFHVMEKINASDLKTCKPDSYYHYNYGQYFKDCKTFERLSLIVNKLCVVPSNPKNLNDLKVFLKSHC